MNPNKTETNRVLLHRKLSSVFETKNIYYQPPPSVRISYPCVVYELSSLDQTYANNRTYVTAHKYKVTYITKDATDSHPETFLDKFRMCKMDTKFISDNLYHYVFTLQWEGMCE